VFFLISLLSCFKHRNASLQCEWPHGYGERTKKMPLAPPTPELSHTAEGLATKDLAKKGLAKKELATLGLTFLPQEIIRDKRDGKALTRTQIANFIDGVNNQQITDAQVAAFTMSVFFQGMSADECVALTLAMRDSGRVMRWEHFNGPVLDKHSTGGVGDVVSLPLAPMLAACGAYVPMISGRGLGHTGGTLDKLTSIPGYDVNPDPALFERVVRDVGCAIIGQTNDLAPADRKLYAIRDVTGSVESVPLITASILSKKLAAGLQSLIMDVKVGNGAFMTSLEEAQALARSLVSVAKGAGLPTRALLTDMNEPLAPCAGNALEVLFAVNYLKGSHRDTRFHTVTLALCAHLLVLGGIASTLEEGERKALNALDSGKAAEKFVQMASALGGSSFIMETPKDILPKALVIKPIFAKRVGFISHIDTRALGLAVIQLGGGRMSADARIDLAVGLSDLLPIGAYCEGDTPLGFVHSADEMIAERVAESVRNAYTLSDHNSALNPVFFDVIGD
jgi:thymidine phosphorylase